MRICELCLLKTFQFICSLPSPVLTSQETFSCVPVEDLLDYVPSGPQILLAVLLPLSLALGHWLGRLLDPVTELWLCFDYAYSVYLFIFIIKQV